MKISLKWLNDFIDISDYMTKPQVLADLLTRSGLEVEEIQNKAQDLAHVVIGHIQVKDKHPNADKLSLCQVDVGSGNILQIVCGAQNHKTGDKVIVALPGAVLPGNFVIKKSKIRDIESSGMLCSLKELALADVSDGIVILPSDAPIGESYAVFAGLDDVTFELKVTPNRADCLSHYGLARELGCVLNKNVKSPEILTRYASASTKTKINLTVKNSDLCSRYAGRYISGVKIGPSPLWLKKRLESVGQNSINNVVDITNYVMLEMGQPLHAFDADQISGAQIIVRMAVVNEKFKTLKDQDLSMTGEELLICDQDRALALAGVIGGLNSGVTETTQNIFLESACFQNMSVRKSSRRHGVDTDSAYRFSRGVDSSSSVTNMDRAALLILQVAGGEAYGEAYDFHPTPVVKKTITLGIKTVSERLGYAVDEVKFVEYMKALHINVESISKGQYKMTPPVFRFDIEQDMDLVEEYARLHGYEHIQETIPALHIGPVSHDADYLMNQKVSNFMRSEGFSQAFNYAFTSMDSEKKWLGDSQYLAKTGFDIDSEIVKIMNPLSEELNSMRRSLVYGLWQNTVSNIRLGNSQGSLFEVGSVFSKKENSYSEQRKISLVKWGESTGLHALTSPLVQQLRSSLEKWFLSMQISAFSFVTQSEAPSFVHLGQWAQVLVEGRVVGFIGSAHPRFLGDEKIRVPVAFAELDLNIILKGQPRAQKFKTLSKFQPIERDFAFVMQSATVIGDLVKEVKKAAGSIVKEISVFDIYEGDKLPQGLKSVALRVSFQALTDVLTETELQQVSQKIVDAAMKSVNASLR